MRDEQRAGTAFPGLVWTATTDGQINDLNQHWCAHTGREFKDLYGRGWQELVHTEDLVRLLDLLRAASTLITPVEIEVRLQGMDGRFSWFLFLVQPVVDAVGRVIRWTGFSIDIDKRKRIEEELRENAARFRDYAETASDWLWEIGPDYDFTMLTENAFGADPVDRIGTKCWDHALDFETEPEKWKLILDALESRRPFRDFVYCSVDGRGSPIYVKASGKPVFGANGELSGYRGTGTDVTASKRAERAENSLRTAQSELAHISRVTTFSQITASVTHELTQPISAALINAQAALRFLTRESADVESG